MKNATDGRARLRAARAATALLFLTACAACGDRAPVDGGAIAAIQLAASGYTFDARVSGPQDGPLVLLLHGFPESSLEWEAQLTALGRAGYRAVAPDLRGYSPGARPPDAASYRLDLLSADVIGMADALGARRFHVVGHDWGASIAWQTAIAYPDRVVSLTAVSVPHPAAFALALGTDPDQQQRSGYFDFFRQVGTAEDALRANDAALLRSVYGGKAPPAHVDAYVARLSEPGALTAALNYYRALYLGGTRIDPATVPTLYVWSTADSALGRFGAEATVNYVTGPYRFEVIEGVSHWVPEEAAATLTDLLLDHLAAYR